ncbi:MAG: cytochrome ubiquinol oxidase subunit I [Burkholderiales bacterium]|nr:cytochrome ubiquinol oxidase subunit I [Burkholderiales bacterium]
MDFDALYLSRLQFAFTMAFHIIFPAFSIGLSTFLVVMEGLWLKTKKPVYYQIIRFWTKVFALTFGMGVISGIVMEFQLGTNWAGFAKQIGSVLGPLFIYEVLTAFFVEAGFIGILFFGWNKVGPKLHYLATILVCIGTSISAYWIMSANSWMQHPIAYQITDGKFIATDWLSIMFNPYNLPRYLHMMLASYLATSFVIISISAYYLLNNKFVEFAKKCLSSASIVVMILIPLQIFIGDVSGVQVFKTQPLKTAAIEGIWDTQQGAPFLLFALPSNQDQKNYAEIGIPNLASLINTHQYNGEMQGLKSVPPEEQPEAWIVFWSFRIMVGLGLLMFLYAVLSLGFLLKNKLFDSRKMLLFGKFMAPTGFIAILTGWFTAEVGRQPWIVYNLISTQSAVSSISTYDVLVSFALMVIVYGVIFGYFYFYFLDKTIKKGPLNPEMVQPFSYLGAAAQNEGEVK